MYEAIASSLGFVFEDSIGQQDIDGNCIRADPAEFCTRHRHKKWVTVRLPKEIGYILFAYDGVIAGGKGPVVDQTVSQIHQVREERLAN